MYGDRGSVALVVMDGHGCNRTSHSYNLYWLHVGDVVVTVATLVVALLALKYGIKVQLLYH